MALLVYSVTSNTLVPGKFGLVSIVATAVEVAEERIAPIIVFVNICKSKDLDVYESEPELTEGMVDLENLLLLPHIGSASFETRDRMALLVADNVLDVLSGKTPRSLVPGYLK